MSMNSSLRSLPHFQVHESSKSDKYEDTGVSAEVQEVAESLYGVILGVLVTF